METKTGVDVAREMGIAHPGAAALQVIERGSIGEAAAGAGALVLALLGLIGLLPLTLNAIGVICAGVALLFAGASVVARHTELAGAAESRRVVVGGMELVAFAGVASVALGILALLRVSPMTLLAVSPIVLGVALLAESNAVYRLDEAIERQAPRKPRAEEVVRAASGSDAVIGVGAIVLGILALSGSAPVTLSLVATLAIGAGVVFSGSSLAAQIFGLFR